MYSIQEHNLSPQYDNIYALEQTNIDMLRSNNQKKVGTITPWDADQKSIRNINKLSQFDSVRKSNCQRVNQNLEQDNQTLNFIQRQQKGKKSRCSLGKCNTTSQSKNKNQCYHLNMNKIQFKQFQKNLSTHQNHYIPHANHRINFKDFSSIQNNFFIKSYFVPNSLKTGINQKPLSLESKKKNQYKKLKHVQAPTFLAIKSVDLKEKFMLNLKDEEDDNNSIELNNDQFFSTYRTSSILGSSRNSRRMNNKSAQSKYQSVKQEQHQKYNKTIQSTKESSKQLNDSLRSKYKFALEEMTRKQKITQNPDFIATTSSFIKRNSPSIKQKKDQLKQQKKSVSNSYGNGTSKITSKSKDKHSILTTQRVSKIQRLKCLKTTNLLENFLQNLSPYMEQKSLLLPKNEIHFQIPTVRQIKPQKEDRQITASPRLRRRVDTSNLNTRQFMNFQKPAQTHKFAIKTINKSNNLMIENQLRKQQVNQAKKL